MKKKFEISDIEQFFQITNNIAPIYNEEKVHQIISRPNAQARLKGKNNNLLKFIIMTTFFSIILISILIWQNNIHVKTTLTSSKTIPKSNTNISVDSMADFQSEHLKIDQSSHNKYSNNMRQSITQPNSSSHANEEKILNRDKPDDILDTIFPINGGQFIVKANKLLLERLGFTLKGAGIYYQNYTPESGFVARHVYSSKDKSILYSFGNQYLLDSIPITYHNYFLQMVTYTSSEIIDYRSIYPSIEMANDTLLPILVPAGYLNNNDLNDEIYWFRVTDNLLDDIPNLSDNVKEKLKNAIRFKRKHKEINVIDYQIKPIIAKTNFIDLNINELKPLGLFIEGEILKLRYRKNSTTIGERFVDYDVTREIENIYNDSLNYFYMPVVTDTFGLLKNVEGKFNFEHLIPVLAKSEVWKSYTTIRICNLVLWFEPSLSFFKALPKKLGDQLKAEYNYITAEDQSSLVKPECKYFDECKNTLDATKFKVFPNPANNNITVSFNIPQPIMARILLVDLTGKQRQVLQPQNSFAKGTHAIDIDISNVPDGIYLVTLYSDKGIQTQRLMISR